MSEARGKDGSKSKRVKRRRRKRQPEEEMVGKSEASKGGKRRWRAAHE